MRFDFIKNIVKNYPWEIKIHWLFCSSHDSGIQDRRSLLCGSDGSSIPVWLTGSSVDFDSWFSKLFNDNTLGGRHHSLNSILYAHVFDSTQALRHVSARRAATLSTKGLEPKSWPYVGYNMWGLWTKVTPGFSNDNSASTYRAFKTRLVED